MKSFQVAAAAAAIFAGSLAYVAVPAHAESVMKECGAEWKQAKADNKTNGQSWREYLAECKTRHASAAPTTPVAAPSPAPTMAPKPAAPAPKPTMAAAPTGAGQFASEGEAKGRCPSDIVVWVNTNSHKYHFAGHRSYGTTKKGAYMCEADAKAAGDIAAKGEKPKG